MASGRQICEDRREACLGPLWIRDVSDIGIFWIFIKGYGIFQNFKIWDIEIENIILGYGIFWENLFWDMEYCIPTKQPSEESIREG